jgi:putative holliday junction resolvase
MPVVTLQELKSALPKGKRLLGLDHSKKSWGLAVATPETGIATPLKTIRCTTFAQDAKILAGIFHEYGAGALVIGLPLNMDGSEGPRAQSVRHFAANLLAARALSGDPLIAFCDERLSTHAAEDLLSGRRHAEGAVDALAAQIMLQSALDIMRRG